MKAQTFFVTKDGQHHDTQRTAVRHAEAVYGYALTSIAHKIIACDWKYLAVCEFIEAHLDEFVELRKLKADIEMENHPDGDD